MHKKAAPHLARLHKWVTIEMDRPSYTEDEWASDYVEDYNHAQTDDERRAMLRSFGCDEAHHSEMERLFPLEPLEPESKPEIHSKGPDWSKRGALFTLLGIGVAALIFLLTLLLQWLGFPRPIS